VNFHRKKKAMTTHTPNLPETLFYMDRENPLCVGSGLRLRNTSDESQAAHLVLPALRDVQATVAISGKPGTGPIIFFSTEHKARRFCSAGPVRVGQWYPSAMKRADLAENLAEDFELGDRHIVLDPDLSGGQVFSIARVIREMSK
jgi:hypothetical protein